MKKYLQLLLVLLVLLCCVGCDQAVKAIAWLERSPFQDAEVEVRQVFEAEDFGAEFAPELREQEERLRA